MPSMTRAGYTPPKGKKPRKSARASRRENGKGTKKRVRISAASVVSLVILALAVAIGAGTLYLYAQTSPYRETFAPGTFFEGTPLAGYTFESGVALVNQLTQERVDAWRYEIGYEGTSYVLTAQEAKLQVDAEATLRPLYEMGKGNFVAAWLDLLALSKEPVDAKIVVAYDMAAADDLLALVKADIDRPSEDARVAFTPGDSEPFVFTDEIVGLELDTQPLHEAIEAALQTLSRGETQAQPHEIEPQVYAADLRAATVLRARVTLAIQSDEAAFANASLAARALNGMTVAPGETLSFNEAVGVRTKERGYVEAPEPAYGEDALGVGGGVCQTATALYQLALLGCVTVSERHAATQVVPYAEAGQEAAVSDQGLDLALVNEGDTALFLTARAYVEDEARYMELQLIGEPLSARYALITSAERLPAPEEPVYVRDNAGRYATYTDERVLVTQARDGVRAKVERVAFDEVGIAISRETISQEEYAPVAQAIYVGVQQREQPETR